MSATALKVFNAIKVRITRNKYYLYVLIYFKCDFFGFVCLYKRTFNLATKEQQISVFFAQIPLVESANSDTGYFSFRIFFFYFNFHSGFVKKRNSCVRHRKQQLFKKSKNFSIINIFYKEIKREVPKKPFWNGCKIKCERK